MKKVIGMMLTILLMISSIVVYAANEVKFEVSYDGAVKQNEVKPVSIVLTGVGAPLYSNVRVKVQVQGPATPKLIATDSLGTQIDIAQTGYWGPEAGFAIQGDFTNTTPVTATFTAPGKYSIILTLIDKNNSDSVITSKTIEIEVLAENANTNTTNMMNTTNAITENQITELPKTGTSLGEYTLYAGVALIVVYMIYRVKQKNAV